MEELKKKVKKFYIMFGIEAPAAFFLLFLFSYYILKRQFYPSSYLVMSFSIALIAFRQYKGLQHLLKKLTIQESQQERGGWVPSGRDRKGRRRAGLLSVRLRRG